MHRQFGLMMLSLMLLVVCVLVAESAAAQNKLEVQTLEPGKPIEREMAGGQSHNYQITLSAGQYLKVIVDQRGIDVVVTLFAPDGKQLLEVDSPNGTDGPEPLAWVADLNGVYRLEVRSLEKDAKAGRYEGRLMELRKATANDRAEIERSLAFLEAQQLSGEADKLRDVGQYDKALPLAARALTITEKALGADHPYTATSLNSLALLYRAKGDYGQAEPLYRRALAIKEKALGPEHPETAKSLNNLASLYYARGDYAQAEPLLRRALAIYEKALGPEYPDTALALNNLTELYEARGDYAQAVQMKGRAAEGQERHLSLVLATGSDRQKQLYLNTLSSDLDVAVSLHARHLPADRQAAQLALIVILRRKGRSLDATTEQIGALRRRASKQDVALLDQLLSVRSQQATLEVNDSGKLSPEQWRARITELATEAEKLETTISERSAEFRATIQPITLAGVQSKLPPDAALVEFFVYSPYDAKAKLGEHWGRPRYVAYTLRRDGTLKVADLGEAETIDRAVTAWREALRDRKRDDVKSLARALDELVMRPVRGLVGETRRLLLSPDGALNLIPFAALVDEHNEYLVSRYRISYLTSGRDLLRLQVARESKQAPLIMANPDFELPGNNQLAASRDQKLESDGQSANSSSVPQANQAATSRSLSLADFNAPPLPGTAEEAKAIKGILPEATVLTGQQATETALKQATAPRLLHIATHGFFLDDPAPAPPSTRRLLQQESSALRAPINQAGNPLLRSGRALAGFNLHRNGDDDGVLTALEATGLNLWGTKMVILSACDTGIGTVRNGQGVYGLRRAFVLAGSETQVMSLWPVSDVGTRDLMIEYYKALQRGEGRAEGLRQVQLRMLKDPQRQHPYYWASFIQSGEWANLEGKRSDH